MSALKPRHRKMLPEARCCWICGKPGGMGFTRALRLAGYDVPAGEIGYAHAPCLMRARKAAA